MTDSTYRCGYVALMGPPNAGKSTLLNALLGQKITIVTPKPQTTRNQIVGIRTEPQCQMIFMDTPGLTQQRGRLNKVMLQAVWLSLGDAHVVMPVLDAQLYIQHPSFLEHDITPMVQALSTETRPMIVVLNKIDLFADKSRMLPLLTQLHDIWPQAELFPVSALYKDGLTAMLDILRTRLPEGLAVFPEDQVSTLPVRFMAAEIVREKLFLHLRQEVPYAVTVDIEHWEEDEERGQVRIHAVIYVARSMHKAMVIGRAGATIKQIGIEARKDIQELLERKVYLELWVKVREHWTEDVQFLHEMGLMVE